MRPSAIAAFTQPLLTLATLLALAGPARAATQTFTYTGAEQQFVVPAGATSLTVTASGAQAGSGYNTPYAPGKGGTTTATIAVTPGETLAIYVGGRGSDSPLNGNGVGGYNGGADGGSTSVGGGGGAGASDVRQGGNDLGRRVVIAGGGGGTGGNNGRDGGIGGGLTGGNGGVGINATGGGGGSQSAGGSAGIGSSRSGAAGTLGAGGAGALAGGGGGGGLYGGGGGGHGSGVGSSGGGGSSYATPSATGVTLTQGDHTGDGQVVLTYSFTTFTVSNDAELRAAITTIDDGGTITFANDITLANNLPMITASVTIDGAGHTLDGASTYRGFLVQSGTVLVENLTIAHVKAQGGAGGNGAKGASAAVGGGGGGLGAGAAVFVNTGAAVTLRNVQVGDAAAVGGAGGIFTSTSAGSPGGGGGGGGLGGAGGTGDSSGGGGGGGYTGSGGGGHNGGGGGGGELGNGGSTNDRGGGGGGGTTGNGSNNNGPNSAAGGVENGGQGGAMFVDGGAGGFGGGGGGAGLSKSGGAGGIGGGGGGSGGSGSSGGTGGDFGGGGGAAGGPAGVGGFGGGGGGNSITVALVGGAGGFGAGGGGARTGGAGGMFGGAGGSASAGGTATAGGGGGAALGGAVFTAPGGHLTITDSNFSGNYSVTPGAGGAGDSPGIAGRALGSLAYLNDNTTLDVSSGQTTILNGELDMGSTVTVRKTGEGDLLIGTGATVVLDTLNFFRIEGGRTLLSGPGSIGGSGVVEILSGATLGGTGFVGRPFLYDGGTIGEGAGGEISCNSFTWQPGGIMRARLGATSDIPVIYVVGQLVVTTGSPSHFIQLADGGATPGRTYTLATFLTRSSFTAADFTVTGIAGTLTVEANDLKFTVASTPTYGVSMSMAKGSNRATFTITNTGSTTTGFRLSSINKIINDNHGPKPPDGKPAFRITYLLNGVGATKAIKAGTALATLRDGGTATVVVKVRNLRSLRTKRIVQGTLTATSQVSPGKTASKTVKFVFKPDGT